MTQLQALIDRFGPQVGPKLFHTLRSRAAYKGVSTRRRHQIEALTGRPCRPRRRPAAEPNPLRQLSLLPEAPVSDGSLVSSIADSVTSRPV